MKKLSYNEWLKSKIGQEASATILASNSNMYPDIFWINKQLRMAYEEYVSRLYELRNK
jgi:hypothetical protein